jgi:hypothetical protein
MWIAAAAVGDAKAAVVVRLLSLSDAGAADAYAVVAAAVQVLVVLVHLTVGRRSAAPFLLLGLVLLWWAPRQRGWCRCTPSQLLLLLMLTQRWRRQCKCWWHWHT